MILKEAENQTNQFIKKLNKLIRRLDDELMAIISRLELEEGYILATPKNMNLALELSTKLEGLLKKVGYDDITKQTLMDSRKMADALTFDLVKNLGIAEGVKASSKALNTLLKLQYEDMQNIGQSAVIKLKEILINNVELGQQFKTMAKDMRGVLETRLKPYAETYIKTKKREFIQRTEDEIAKEVGFGEEKDDIWEYAGAPLQDNSHPECEWAYRDKPHAPYFTNEEKEEFENGGGFGHSEPRWNCQHYFAMTNLTYEDYLNA